jgi:RecA-family ATPase
MSKSDERLEADIERVLGKPMNEQDNQTADENPLLAAESWDDFGLQDEAGEPIIEKILSRQEILLIFAPTGVGKSIYVDNIIVALLNGEPLFNEFKVVAPHAVYLCEFEMSSRERGERLRSIGQKPLAQFHAANYMKLGYKLNNAQHFAHFAEAMRKFKPAVIVIDPWKAAHTLDENEATEMDPLIGNIRALMSEINAAVIIVHHTGRDFITQKGARGARHSRGSNALDARCDVIWEIEETDDENVTTLRRHKIRGFRKEMAHEYKMHYDRATGIIVSTGKLGDYADFITHKRLEMKLTQDQLADMLGVTGRAVRYWEAGKYNPSDETIKRIRALTTS